MVRKHDDNLDEYIPLPHHRPSKLSPTFLSGLWKITLLKNALGVKNEDKVREWFLRHPDMMLEFDRLNVEFEIKVFELQERATTMLRDKCIEEFKFHKLTIEDEPMDMDINMTPDITTKSTGHWVKKEKK